MFQNTSATVALFDPTSGCLPRRRLDVERSHRFLTRLVHAGATSFLVASSTGHGHLRTVAEMESMFRCAADIDLPNASLMGLLRPEDGIKTNERMLSLLRELGYVAAYLRPGTNLTGPDDTAVVANLTPLVRRAKQIGIPVGLYSISDVSGAPLTANATSRLVAGKGGDGIFAIKVTEADYEASTLSFLKHPELKHLKVVQGWDPHLARALKDGTRYWSDGSQRCGVTSGAMSFAVFQYLHILAACDECDWPEVAVAQSAVTQLFAAMQDDPTKFADLQRAKFIMGLGHPMMSEITPDQTDRVMNALTNLPRAEDRQRLAASLDLMQDGPFHDALVAIQDDCA